MSAYAIPCHDAECRRIAHVQDLMQRTLRSALDTQSLPFEGAVLEETHVCEEQAVIVFSQASASQTASAKSQDHGDRRGGDTDPVGNVYGGHPRLGAVVLQVLELLRRECGGHDGRAAVAAFVPRQYRILGVVLTHGRQAALPP